MALELRQALRRGYEYLAKTQAVDGSWNRSPADTANCSVAIVMVAGHQEYRWLEDRMHTAVAYLKSTQMRHLDAETQATVVRTLLRCGEQSSNPLPKDAKPSLYLLDAMMLSQQPEEEMLKLAEQLSSSDNVFVKSAALSSSNLPGQENIAELADASCEELYWHCRACLGSRQDGHWRNRVMERLLDGQRSDGGWGSPSDTAFALQAAILCL